MTTDRKHHDQDLAIIAEARGLADEANASFSGTRSVTPRMARRVVTRSLLANEGQPFSVRRHRALSDLSAFVTLLQRNKVVGRSAAHTDLLPIAHPASTRRHSLSDTALSSYHARWYLDDPSIADPEARAVLASALSSAEGSPERTYARARLTALPHGSVPQYALLAAFGSGNSEAARRARAMLQRRDRKGRFAFMGGGLRTLVKRFGKVFNLRGRVVGQSADGRSFDVELPDGRMIRVPATASEAIKAVLPSKGRKDSGYGTQAVRTAAGDVVIDEKDLVFIDAPTGFRETGVERNPLGGRAPAPAKAYTDDAYDVQKYEGDLSDVVEDLRRRNDEEVDDLLLPKDYDPSKPTYVVGRNDGSEPLGVVQSWADAQALIKADQDDYAAQRPQRRAVDVDDAIERGIEADVAERVAELDAQIDRLSDDKVRKAEELFDAEDRRRAGEDVSERELARLRKRESDATKALGRAREERRKIVDREEIGRGEESARPNDDDWGDIDAELDRRRKKGDLPEPPARREDAPAPARDPGWEDIDAELDRRRKKGDLPEPPARPEEVRDRNQFDPEWLRENAERRPTKPGDLKPGDLVVENGEVLRVVGITPDDEFEFEYFRRGRWERGTRIGPAIEAVDSEGRERHVGPDPRDVQELLEPGDEDSDFFDALDPDAELEVYVLPEDLGDLPSAEGVDMDGQPAAPRRSDPALEAAKRELDNATSRRDEARRAGDADQEAYWQRYVDQFQREFDRALERLGRPYDEGSEIPGDTDLSDPAVVNARIEEMRGILADDIVYDEEGAGLLLNELEELMVSGASPEAVRAKIDEILSGVDELRRTEAPARPLRPGQEEPVKAPLDELFDDYVASRPAPERLESRIEALRESLKDQNIFDGEDGGVANELEVLERRILDGADESAVREKAADLLEAIANARRDAGGGRRPPRGDDEPLKGEIDRIVDDYVASQDLGDLPEPPARPEEVRDRNQFDPEWLRENAERRPTKPGDLKPGDLVVESDGEVLRVVDVRSDDEFEFEYLRRGRRERGTRPGTAIEAVDSEGRERYVGPDPRNVQELLEPGDEDSDFFDALDPDAELEVYVLPTEPRDAYERALERSEGASDRPWEDLPLPAGDRYTAERIRRDEYPRRAEMAEAGPDEEVALVEAAAADAEEMVRVLMEDGEYGPVLEEQQVVAMWWEDEYDRLLRERGLGPDGRPRLPEDGPEGPSSREYTQDPVEIAQRYDRGELLDALGGAEAPEGGMPTEATLRFGDRDEPVPLRSVQEALAEQGPATPDEMESPEVARVPEGMEGQELEDFIADAIANGRSVAFRYRSQGGPVRNRLIRPIEIKESKDGSRFVFGYDEEGRPKQFRLDYVSVYQRPGVEVPEDDTPAAQRFVPPLLEGLTPEELDAFRESGDYLPYLPENEVFEVPVGQWGEVYPISPEPQVPTAPPTGVPDDFPWDPAQLAESVDGPELERLLRESVAGDRPGYGLLTRPDADGEDRTVAVPAEAIRDALQLQGVDTNPILRDAYDGALGGREPVDLDLDGDVGAQVRDAIDAGRNIRFRYNGVDRDVLPTEVRPGRDGNVNVITVDADGNVKSFTIGRMERLGEDGPADWADVIDRIEAGDPDAINDYEDAVELIRGITTDASPEGDEATDLFNQIDLLTEEYEDAINEYNRANQAGDRERAEELDRAMSSAFQKRDALMKRLDEILYRNDGGAPNDVPRVPRGDAEEADPGDLPMQVGPDAQEDWLFRNGYEDTRVDIREIKPGDVFFDAQYDGEWREVEIARLLPDGDLEVKFTDRDGNQRETVFPPSDNEIVFRRRPQDGGQEPGDGPAPGPDAPEGGRARGWSEIDEGIAQRRANEAQAGEAPAAQVAPDFDPDADRPLLRTAGRNRFNLPDIPEWARRQVYIRRLAGLYADAQGAPLAIGDRVSYDPDQKPDLAEKWPEGIIIGKEQRRYGGLLRRNRYGVPVVYVDYVLVQYPDGRVFPRVSRYQRHADAEVAKQRFDAEPEINWMSPEEREKALADRKKRKKKLAPERQAELDRINEEFDREVRRANAVEAPAPPAAPAVPEGYERIEPDQAAGNVRVGDRIVLNGKEWIVKRVIDQDVFDLKSVVVLQDPRDVHNQDMPMLLKWDSDLNGPEVFRKAPPEPVATEVPEAIPVVPVQELAPKAKGPLAVEGSVIAKMFRLNGDRFVFTFGERRTRNVEDVRVDDFIQTMRGKFGRVVSIEKFRDRRGVERHRITVQYPDGATYTYKPYRSGVELRNVARIPEGLVIERPAGDRASAGVEAAGEAGAPQPPTFVVPQALIDRVQALRDSLGSYDDANNPPKRTAIHRLAEAQKALEEGDPERAAELIREARREGLERLPDDEPDVGLRGRGGLAARDLELDLEPVIEDRKALLDEENRRWREGAGLALSLPGDVDPLDPLAVQEDRVARGVNPVRVSTHWRETLGSVPQLRASRVGGTLPEDVLSEIASFFSGPEGASLAGLSRRARHGLGAIVQERLVNRGGADRKRENIVDGFRLLSALREERLAYEPNPERREVDAVGQFLRNISEQQFIDAVYSDRNKLLVTREEDGQQVDTNLHVVESKSGGGLDSTNKTFIVKDKATGKLYFVKFDSREEIIDSELAALEIQRAMGVLGVYPAQRHNLEGRAIVMEAAGAGSLRLSGRLEQAGDAGFGARYAPNNGFDHDVIEGDFMQLLSMGLLDAIIENPDRHAQNWLVAIDDRGDINSDVARYMPLIIDNGLGLVNNPDDRERYGTAEDEYPDRGAVEYIMSNRGKNGNLANKIKNLLGDEAFGEIAKMSMQQALQTLRRMYPPGTVLPHGLDTLIPRIEEIMNADWS